MVSEHEQLAQQFGTDMQTLTEAEQVISAAKDAALYALEKYLDFAAQVPDDMQSTRSFDAA